MHIVCGAEPIQFCQLYQDQNSEFNLSATWSVCTTGYFHISIVEHESIKFCQLYPDLNYDFNPFTTWPALQRDTLAYLSWSINL
jgi:hypothetical protein